MRRWNGSGVRFRYVPDLGVRQSIALLNVRQWPVTYHPQSRNLSCLFQPRVCEAEQSIRSDMSHIALSWRLANGTLEGVCNLLPSATCCGRRSPIRTRGFWAITLYSPFPSCVFAASHLSFLEAAPNPLVFDGTHSLPLGALK